MDGWARLGAALAGGGRGAYEQGLTAAAQRDKIMMDARRIREEAAARQAFAERARSRGDDDLADYFLAGGNPENLSGYLRDQQGIGWGDEAWKVATSPDRDLELLNAMNLVREGKSVPLTTIQDHTVFNPMVLPQSQELATNDIGQAMIGAENARAASSYASAARSRAGIGADKASNYQLVSTPQGMVRVNRLTGENEPLLTASGEPLMPRPGRSGGSLPASALRLQQQEQDAINAASNVNANLGLVSDRIDQGQLDLGPLDNIVSRVRNAIGMSSPNSRNYASMMATLEKARNESLRLNKGVQTEGDAIRAWNELIANVNDPDVVEQRIREIAEINQRAIDQRQNNIHAIRSNYGAPDLMDTFGEPSYTVGQILTINGRQYRVIGGDPNDPDLEEL